MTFRRILIILANAVMIHTSLLACGEVAQTPTLIPSTFTPPEYSIIFADEFEEVGLSSERWEYRYTGEYGDGVNAEGSITQPGDGFLYLTTSESKLDDVILTSMIRSRQGLRFKYGYFEARIRFQTLRGHHGAFWLQSPYYRDHLDNPALAGAEIDIAEYFGSERTNEFQHNVYWNPHNSGSDPHPQLKLSYEAQYGESLSDDFHIFALLWTPDEYVFYIDGVETWRTSEGVSQVDEYIVLSLITTEDELEWLDRNRLPNAIAVDYVRVYTALD